MTDFIEKKQKLTTFLKSVDIKPSAFILPSSLSLASGLAEAANLAFLFPLAKGVIQGNFLPLLNDQPLVRLQWFFGHIQPSNTVIFPVLVGLVFMTAAAKNALEFFASVSVAWHARRLTGNLRKLLFDRYVSFGKSYFDQNSAGANQQVLINFTDRLGFDLRAVQQSITCIFQLAVYLSVMFFISWQLTLAVIFIFPVLNYSLEWLINKIRATSRDYVKSIQRLSAWAFNIFSCISLVKSCGREKEESRRFAGLSDNTRALEFSVDKKQALVAPLQEVILLFMILLLVGLAAFFMIRGKLFDASALIVYFYVLKKSSNHFRSLNGLKVTFASSLGVWKSIFSILDDRDKYFIQSGDHKFAGLNEAINVRGLWFEYPAGRKILKDCAFSVEKGKTTAIVGLTGSGKTTLAHLLARLYEAPPGSIFFDQTDIRHFSSESFYRHVFLISQDAQLMNDTLYANLTYGVDAPSQSRVLDALRRARLDDLITRLPGGLESVIGDRGVKLSGGEKQRLAIARAILKDAEIMIFDEATSSMDSETENRIQAAIEELIRGRTALVIAHRLSTIKNADKIIVLEEGRVLEEGTLDELTAKKGRFCDFWRAQRFE